MRQMAGGLSRWFGRNYISWVDGLRLVAFPALPEK
jgi:hypothetical protein